MTNLIAQSFSAPSARKSFIASLFVTFILFFVDEGFYDLRWMRDAGDWILFVIYTCVIFLVISLGRASVYCLKQYL